MSRFKGGWIKVWRNLNDHWVGEDGYSFAIFIRLLTWANLEPSKKYENGKLRIIERGSMLTSSEDIAKSFGWDKKTVSRRLAALEEDKMIVQKVSHSGRYITICNYDEYQRYENVGVPPSTCQVPAQSVTMRTHKEELKTLRNKEGEEELILAGATAPALPKRVAKPKEPGIGTPVWESYSNAYQKRYGVKPARNARDASLCKQFVERIGATEAPLVAEFYLTHHNQFYTAKLHPLNLMLADAQKLRTEWTMGAKMTGEIAKKSEVVAHNEEAFRIYRERQKQEGNIL